MEHTDNGWPAAKNLPTRVIEPVKGVKIRIADNDNVEAVFTYLIVNYHRRVEKVSGPVVDDWGFAYRPNANDPNSLSRHSGGIAVDLNALKHPNGVSVPKTLTVKQVFEIHAILDELLGTVRWGGDYHHTIDAMHFEINVSPGQLRNIGRKIRHLEKKRGKYGYQLKVGKDI